MAVWPFVRKMLQDSGRFRSGVEICPYENINSFDLPYGFIGCTAHGLRAFHSE